MGSRSTGYNNDAYWNHYDEPNEIRFDRGGDSVQSYQSYNETFVDDESQSEYDLQLRLRENPRLSESFSSEKCSRRKLSESFTMSRNHPRKELSQSFSTNNNSRRSNELFLTNNDQRNGFNESFSTNSDPRSSFDESFSTNNDYKNKLNGVFLTNNAQRNGLNQSFFRVEARNREKEPFLTNNNRVVGLNESFSTGNSPRKLCRKERSSSVPGRRNTMDVFAPMVAQCQEVPSIRRSRSTVRLQRDGNVLSPTTQRRSARPEPLTYTQTSCNVRPMIPNIAAVKPERLHSFDRYCEQEMIETSLLSPEQKRRVAPTLAVIPPNCRNNNKSVVPLLAHSPTKFRSQNSDFDRSPMKGSWLQIPSQQGRPESMWFAGIILLISGFAICVLCFCLLSKKRKSHSFFLELGAVSGFGSFVIGFLGFRTNTWDWLPNRNYVSGYIILILLNLLQCGVLAILSSGWKDIGSPEGDIASGAIGGLAVLILLLSILGLGASTCCKNPPPDNRVAHCAQGFIV